MFAFVDKAFAVKGTPQPAFFSLQFCSFYVKIATLAGSPAKPI